MKPINIVLSSMMLAASAFTFSNSEYFLAAFFIIGAIVYFFLPIRWLKKGEWSDFDNWH